MTLNSHLTRQFDIISDKQRSMPVKIIGCGAIGSFLTLQLAKMGFEDLEVWDFDEVSIENMSCQFFRFKDIGKNKAMALDELVEDFTNVSIEYHPEKFEAKPDLNGIVVVAVDSMKAREEIFKEIQSKCFQVKMIIDPRMGAEDAALYVMNPFDEKDSASYSKTLYSDENSVQERCTAKSTVYTANLLSGLCAKAIKNISCEQKYPRVSQWSICANSLQSWEN